MIYLGGVEGAMLILEGGYEYPMPEDVLVIGMGHFSVYIGLVFKGPERGAIYAIDRQCRADDAMLKRWSRSASREHCYKMAGSFAEFIAKLRPA